MPLLIYDRLLLLCDAVYATSQHDLSCADPFRSSNLTVIIQSWLASASQADSDLYHLYLPPFCIRELSALTDIYLIRWIILIIRP
jgi:hypothetical protein